MYFHGTTLERAMSIAKEGLRFLPDERFQIIAPNGKKMADVDGNDGKVFVTSDFFLAKRYALFRAAYEQAVPGSMVKFPFAPEKFNYLKYGENVSVKAEPAIVAINVPKYALFFDKPSGQNYYKGDIPANDVMGVLDVAGKPLLDKDWQIADSDFTQAFIRSKITEQLYGGYDASR